LFGNNLVQAQDNNAKNKTIFNLRSEAFPWLDGFEKVKWYKNIFEVLGRVNQATAWRPRNLPKVNTKLTYI
jgi:hypothetical protein